MSHQQGHLGAAAYGKDLAGDYLAFHVSGGTTELLTVRFGRGNRKADRDDRREPGSFGGTGHRPARGKPGVASLGGPEVETAAGAGRDFSIKTSVAGTWANFSGIESILERERKNGTKGEDLCLSALTAIAKTLYALLEHGAKETGISRALFSGGVMCNQIIRDYLLAHTKKELIFAKREYASDNAVGVALQARALYKEQHKGETRR